MVHKMTPAGLEPATYGLKGPQTCSPSSGHLYKPRTQLVGTLPLTASSSDGSSARGLSLRGHFGARL